MELLNLAVCTGTRICEQLNEKHYSISASIYVRTYLCFKCCGVPIHLRPALARIPTLLHRFSHSATLCEVRITQL